MCVGFRQFCKYSLGRGEPFIKLLSLMEMPAITAFQKDQGKNLQEKFFFIGRGKIFTFFSVIVVLFLLLKCLKYVLADGFLI